MNLWGIHRGGGPTKVTLGFTGHHRAYPLTEPITFDLTWNGQPVNEAPLHADNPNVDHDPGREGAGEASSCGRQPTPTERTRSTTCA